MGIRANIDIILTEDEFRTLARHGCDLQSIAIMAIKEEVLTRKEANNMLDDLNPLVQNHKLKEQVTALRQELEILRAEHEMAWMWEPLKTKIPMRRV